MTSCDELGPKHQPGLINDGLPMLDPLCDLQAAIAQTYATLLANLAQQHAAASPVEKVGLGIVLERLRRDALWAVSEVHRDNKFKIRRQRYISQAVFDRWLDLQRELNPRSGVFEKDAFNQTLVHEHVVQRRGLGIAMGDLIDQDELLTLLLSVKACVVSKDEDKSLPPRSKGFDGWERYRRANPPFGVYDRKMKCWVIPRQDA